ncbi:hypothetical protein AN216_01955 [Streptomyces oceani]|uniref:Aminotransferase class I/classII large domain-containing protein n=1 Tax=Streptomyces oceani TaxID=1075402 RepID=A0A1E7KPF9_9ACTN|nr:hypothetical protein AN216_01955 [Streptomyces oceani]
MDWSFESIVQHAAAEGVYDLGPGYLDPQLIPVPDIKAAFDEALSRYGAAALAYGHNQGALPFRAAVADRLADGDGTDYTPSHLLATGGTSQALDLLAAAVAEPGQAVVVESLTYDLALQIFRDRGLVVYAVERDSEGMLPSAVDQAAARARQERRGIAFVYLVPTFHNPTGSEMSQPRRTALLESAARHQMLVVEDDAYADLPLTPRTRQPSLAGLADFRGVVRLGTFSKSLAPGLRLGWLAAGPRLCRELAGRGLFTSGGCPSHLAALAVGLLLESGFYEDHLRWLHSELKCRRDALTDTLHNLLPGEWHLRPADGGLFSWVDIPAGVSEFDAVAAAEQGGVLTSPGERFGSDAEPGVRLSYAYNSPERLAAAAASLADAWRPLSAG